MNTEQEFQYREAETQSLREKIILMLQHATNNDWPDMDVVARSIPDYSQEQQEQTVYGLLTGKLVGLDFDAKVQDVQDDVYATFLAWTTPSVTHAEAAKHILQWAQNIDGKSCSVPVRLWTWIALANLTTGVEHQSAVSLQESLLSKIRRDEISDVKETIDVMRDRSVRQSNFAQKHFRVDALVLNLQGKRLL